MIARLKAGGLEWDEYVSPECVPIRGTTCRVLPNGLRVAIPESEWPRPRDFDVTTNRGLAAFYLLGGDVHRAKAKAKS